MKPALFIFAFYIIGGMHPIHVSLTNIEYHTEKNSFVIAFKIFTDDLESVIDKKFGIQSNIGKKDELEGIEEFYTKYITEHFRFKINGKTDMVKNLKYSKKEQNFEATWLYYEVFCKGKVQSVRIKASFLDDLYPDQKNLVIFNYKGKSSGFEFKAGDKPEEIELR